MDSAQDVPQDLSAMPELFPQPARACRASGKRIVFVIDRLAGRGGGAERVLTQVANALAARGHLIEIVTHERSKAAPFFALVPGVILTRLRPPRPYWRAPFDKLRGPVERHGHHLPGLRHLAWFSRHGGFWRRLARYLGVLRPDAVIAVMPPAITALSHATRHLRRNGVMIRTLAATHNTPEQDFCNPSRWGPGPLDRARRVAALQDMDRIAVLLAQYRDWYTPALRARITVIANPISPVALPMRADPASARRIVTVGRLAEVKRLDLLIDAFALLAPDFPDWQLHIYGEGLLHDSLSARIDRLSLGHAVTLMGQHRDMAQVYRNAALLAHPAEYEGFPLAVSEALAAGVPVLGFADCSGVNALVRHGVNGVLVPAPQGMTRAARVQAFAAALKGLMAAPAQRAALGAQGPDSMASYAPETIMDAWEVLALADLPEPAPCTEGA